jgi:hypothetical protein
LLLAAVATGSVAMPEKEPFPVAGTAEQAGPNGAVAMLSLPEPVEPAELGLEVDEFDWGIASPAALALSLEPQAARPRGTARASAARQPRRVGLMFGLLRGAF